MKNANEFKKYECEAQAKWDNTDAYREHTLRTKNYTDQKWNDLVSEMDRIMEAFATCKRNGEKSDCEQVQELVETLQNHISENYYRCTDEILAGLGQMYVADERFRSNIDQHAEGTAAFVCEAIKCYCRPK